MSKKTPFFAIVLIIAATFIGSELLTKDIEYQAPIPEQTNLITEITPEEEWIISSYDEMMRRIGEEEGQDWLLMSAIAYSESRFHADLTSKQGAIGLMQIMPIVGRQFNISKEEIADPETNIRLAGKLLRQIEKTLKIHPSTPVNDRLSIILACYNGGIGHVSDARRLARVHGDDPNSWEDVARYLALKADPAYYEHEVVRNGRFTGYKQTAAYVENVRNSYARYCRRVARQ